jgi:tetratricopeptide (TPR) repeat protein
MRLLALLLLLLLGMPPAFAAGQTAESFLEQHDAAGAIGVLQMRVDSNPKDLEALRKISCIYLYFSNFKAASAYLSMALRLTPDDKQLHYWRGVCFYRLGKTQSALKDFLVAMPHASLQALRCYAKLNRTEDVQKTLALLLASSQWANEDDMALREIGHDFGRAKQLVNERYPDANDPYGHIELGEIFLAQQKWQDAANEFNLAVTHLANFSRPPRLSHGRAIARSALGEAALAADDYVYEIEALRKLPSAFSDQGVRYKQQQDLITAYGNLAQLQRKLGRAAEADASEREQRKVKAEIAKHLRSFYTLGDIFERPEHGLEQDPSEIGLSNFGYDLTKFTAAR